MGKVVDAVRAAVQKALKNEYNEFITVCAQSAMEEARRLEESGASGGLCGQPIAIKDNICTKGIRTTAASRLLENYIPAEDAFAVEKLRAAGLVIVGKTNMDEFGMGSNGLLSAFGPTRSPISPERVPGGSSSGSAAAVASGTVRFALGSDTGGSVRVPAACCGIVGYKPTWGAVSRRGLIAYASSLDQIGILARGAADCRDLMAVIAGKDERDDSSFDLPQPADADRRNNLAGLRYAVWEAAFDAADEAGKQAVQKAAQALESLGARRTDTVYAPTLTAETYAVLAAAESGSCLARYDGLRYGASRGRTETTRGELFGREVRRRLTLSSTILGLDKYSPLIDGARAQRERICRFTEETFRSVDILLSPTISTAAPLIGEASEDGWDAFAPTANLAGIPAISLPVGKKAADRSVQLMTAWGTDALLLNTAVLLEKELER